MELLQAASSYAARGFAVFPTRGKQPLTPHGFKDATTEQLQIEKWWRRTPHAGIGIATGARSGCWVFDIDGEAGFESLRDREAQHGQLPWTPTAITPGAGEHRYFRYVEPVACSAGALGPGLDVRGDGGYVVAPPSAHPNGGIYEWASEAHLDDLPFAVAPAWLVESQPRRLGSAAGSKCGSIPEGARNSTLASLAGAMRRHGALEETITVALLMENESRCDPPLPEHEVWRIAQSIARYAATPGLVPPPITVKVR